MVEFDKIRKDKIADIELQKEEEKHGVVEGLNEALESGILTLRLQHKRQVAVEEEKIARKYAHLSQDVENFFESEVQLLKTFIHRAGSADRSAAKKQAQEHAKLQDYVFGGNKLPRLIALAEYL